MPVADFTSGAFNTRDRVRIVASQNNTNITTLIGGTIQSVEGGQMSLTNLQAGQFVELEIILNNNGCYIQSDKPIGVCTYLAGYKYYGTTTSTEIFPAQAWVPSIEQTTVETMIAPSPAFYYAINLNYALVVSSTATKNNTLVSIGGASPVPLSGGSWRDHVSGFSSYNMPLTNDTASYSFTNQAGTIILCYGKSSFTPISYYYLAGSATRNLSAAFTANNISYNELHNHPFCEHDITFFANVEGIHPNAGSLNWYINGVHQPTLIDQLTWSQNFATGNHVIKMSVVFVDNSTETYQDTLKIRSCEAAFYANNVHHANLPDTTFCDNVVHFHTDVSGLHPDPESLKWFIDGDEVTTARDQLTWSKTFDSGSYALPVEMWVRYENGETETFYSTLNLRVFWTKIRNVRH